MKRAPLSVAGDFSARRAICFILLVSFNVTGCGPSAAGKSQVPATPAMRKAGGSTRLVLLKGTRAAAIPRALGQAATGAGLKECGFAWGNLRNPLPEGRRAVLALDDVPERPNINGMLVCGKAIEALLKHPRLHQVVMLEWREGQLLASHPSGPGRTAFKLDELERRPEASDQRTFAIFWVHPSDKITVAELWPTLVRLPRTVMFAIWMIGTVDPNFRTTG